MLMQRVVLTAHTAESPEDESRDAAPDGIHARSEPAAAAGNAGVRTLHPSPGRAHEQEALTAEVEIRSGKGGCYVLVLGSALHVYATLMSWRTGSVMREVPEAPAADTVEATSQEEAGDEETSTPDMPMSADSESAVANVPVANSAWLPDVR